MISCSAVRTAALAFALSSWVEGLTHIRTILLAPALRREQVEDTYEPSPLSFFDASWREKIVAWLIRDARRDSEMDDNERACLGMIDITTAFIVSHALKQPLMLPYMISPFLTTVSIPRSGPSPKAVKWSHLMLSTVVLALVHEFKRVLVFTVFDQFKKHREAKNKALLGEVYVRGRDLQPRDDDEEEEECLICAGVGADTNPMSHSISSLSSMATTSAAAPLDALGPLEAFCSIAPQKHVAHRTCFLSWHAAYRQQIRNSAPEYILLQHPSPTDSESVRSRAQVIVEAAKFSHLSRAIRFERELPWSRVLPANSEGRLSFQPTLTLTENLVGPSSQNPNTSRLLATLHTTTPPCPGCRSSVLLQLFARPVTRSKDKSRQETRRAALRRLIRLWIDNWGKLVTGKTLLYRIASQWSFIVILLSVIHGGPPHHA